jgi:hypothetical protein
VAWIQAAWIAAAKAAFCLATSGVLGLQKQTWAALWPALRHYD